MNVLRECVGRVCWEMLTGCVERLQWEGVLGGCVGRVC